jgi:hypothetical protein
MSSIFGKLGYNFDSAKFGDSLTLPDKVKTYLNTAPVKLETWQLNDIANGNIQLTDYYKNPVLNICNQIMANVNTIIAVVNTITTYDSIPAQAVMSSLSSNVNSTIIEFQKFISHTSNISGVTNSRKTAGTDIDYPDYNKAVNLGQQLLLLTNQSDSVQNSTPLLGSMTSLFVGNDLAANLTVFLSDLSTLNASIRPVTTSSITLSQATAILSHINTANNLVTTRKDHDFNFYRNGQIVMTDYNKVSRLTKLGNTQTYLVNNLIGTDKYKDNV